MMVASGLSNRLRTALTVSLRDSSRKSLASSADHVGAGVLVEHTGAVVIDAVSANVVFKVVFQAMEDTGEILERLSVTEGHQLEQDMERQRGHWKRRPILYRNGNGIGHDVAEARHVQDDAVFEFQPISGDRFVERKDIRPTPVAVVQAMGSACAREPVFGKSALQQIEILEPLDDDGHVHIVGLAGRLNIQEKFGDKRSHDSERDTQLPQSAFKVDDNPHQAWEHQRAASSRTFGRNSSAASSACPVPR